MINNYFHRSLKFITSIISGLLLVFFSFSNLHAQVNINGSITDNSSGEELIGATIKIIGTKYGCVTDFNGSFNISTNTKLPFVIEVSYVGYKTIEISVKDEKSLKIRLKSDDMQLEAVEVIGGLSEKLKESPLSIESMSINGIKETSATNFYEGLSHMKGVDLTSASLGFKVINTRGFNSTSPVRSLQIIDGVDNASPGLNFALGNFLGASELDLMKVEIVSGASSAFFGPNAFNGVISMHTKSPFLFPGFSSSIKLGERNLNEYAVRYAQVFQNKDGEDKFAYKLNLYYMSADDWVANNSNSVTGLDTDESNPGGYDAVNRYGDENISPNYNNNIYDLYGDTSLAAMVADPGLGRWHRKGYWEQDLVDYDTENFKAALGLHYMINKDIELITSSNFGTGTTVYQGDNRFSLKDILFFQNKIEIKKENNFFLRAYATHEDAGNSYDAVLTAFQLQEAACNEEDYDKLYKTYWWNEVNSRVRDLNPNIDWSFHPPFDPLTGAMQPPDYDAIIQTLNENQDSLIVWHEETSNYANSNEGNAITNNGALNYFEPGTARFDSMMNIITSTASVLDGGSKIVDKSALYHIHGEKIWDTDFAKFTLGINSRIYTPKSEGSLFSDTGNVTIINKEIGGYIGFEKKILSDQFIIKTSLRLDKNQNFNLLPSPAASIIYNLSENHNVRGTFTSAIRNPTLLNQYMYYNVGRAKLVGNINGYDSLVTIESLRPTLINQETDSLNYFNLDPIRPEKVKSIELGYRGTFNGKFYIDAGYYYNWYKDFIGFLNAAKVFIPTMGFGDIKIQEVYRIATNSNEQITTQGFSLGCNYYFNENYMINGNYSWNKLNKLAYDPIIPSYNTPEHKFNLGLTGRDISIDALNINQIGFNINFKWIEGFIFEGSPQFTGNVPTYGLLDFQITKAFSKKNFSTKFGASNVLNNKVLQVFGGPYVGRMIYLSILFDWKDK
jgi:iron complex outermembrane recepter protein